MAAENGSLEGMYFLGFTYYEGIGVEMNLDEAFKWFKLSAEKGHELSQFLLANSYFDGIGVEKDIIEAMKWLMLSVENGNRMALLVLASNLFGGNYIKPDNEKAFNLFNELQHEFSETQKYLGLCYLYGKGVEQDFKKAITYFEKSIEYGSYESDVSSKSF